MKALLYSDWASLRKSMKSFLFSIFMICGIVTFVSISNEGMDAETVAETIQSNIMATGSLMFAFFSFFNLFGQDEHAGWESVKLSLPVSRREVVVGRYLIMAIIIAYLGVGAVAIPTGIISAGFVEQYGQMMNSSPSPGTLLQTVGIDIDSKWLGLSLGELEHQFGIVVVIVQRGDKSLPRSESYRIELKDILTVYQK